MITWLAGTNLDRMTPNRSVQEKSTCFKPRRAVDSASGSPSPARGCETMSTVSLCVHCLNRHTQPQGLLGVNSFLGKIRGERKLLVRGQVEGWRKRVSHGRKLAA